MDSMYRRHNAGDVRARILLASLMLASATTILAEEPVINLGDIANPMNQKGYSFSTLGELDGGLAEATGVGDMNHDGFGDFAYVSRSSNPSDPIEVIIRHGRPGGMPDDEGNTLDETRISIDVTFGNGIAAYFSSVEVAGIGDFDGDGFDDIAISLSGLRDLNMEGQEVGGTIVLYGPLSGDIVLGSDFFFGDSPHQGMIHLGYDLGGNPTEMGQAITGIGDFNGDGYHDFAVASTYEAPAKVYIILGGSRLNGVQPTEDLLDSDRILVVHNPDHEVYGGFGTVLTPVGDINGDGFDDLGIGDTNLASESVYSEQAAHILLGGPHGSIGEASKGGHDFLEPVTIMYSTSGGFVAAGTTIRGLGDINGDGYADFAVGDPRFDDDFGALIVYFGGPDWIPGFISHNDIPTSETIRITNREFGMSEELYFGGSIAPAGDFTGNGYNDFLVSHGRSTWMDSTGNSRAFLVEGSPDIRDMDISEILIGTWPGLVFTAPPGEDSPGKRFAVIDDLDGDFRSEIMMVTNIVDAPTGDPRERAYILFSDDGDPIPMILDFYADSTTITVEHSGVTNPTGVLNSIGVWSRQKFPSVQPWTFHGFQLYSEGETIVELPWEPAPGTGHEIATRIRDGFGWFSDFHYSFFGTHPEAAPPIGLDLFYDAENGEIVVTFDTPGTAESGIGFWEREVKDTTDDILQPTEPLTEWTYNGVIPLAANAEELIIPFDDGGGAHQISVGIRRVGEQGFTEVKDIIAAPDGVLVTPRLIDVFSPPHESAVMKAVFDPPGNIPDLFVEFEYRPIQPSLIQPRALSSWQSAGNEQYPGIGAEVTNLPHQPATGTSIRQVWSTMTTPEPEDGEHYEHRARLVTYDMMTEQAFQIGGEQYANEKFSLTVEENSRLDIDTFRYLPLSPGDMFGASVISLGDITGNGVPDMAVLMPGNSVQEYEATPVNSEYRNTTVWIFIMDEGGLVRESIPINRTLEGIGSRYPGVVDDRMEESLIAPGDITFSGSPDLIVLDPNFMRTPDAPVTGGFSLKTFDASGNLANVNYLFPSGSGGGSFPGSDVTRLGMAGAWLGGIPSNPQRGDIAVTGYNGDNQLAIYIIDVNRTVGYTELVPREGLFEPEDPNFNPTILAAGDVSGNGVKDLLAVSTEEFTKSVSSFHIIFRDENGEVEDVVLVRQEDFGFPLYVNDVVSASMVDLTGDGVADILLGGRDSAPLHYILLNRNGTYYQENFISSSELLGDDIDLGWNPSISVALYEEDPMSTAVKLALGNRHATTSMFQKSDKGEVHLIEFNLPEEMIGPIARINNNTSAFRARLQKQPEPMEFGKSMVVINDLFLGDKVELLIGAPGYLPHGAVFLATVTPSGDLIEARKYAPGHPDLPLHQFNATSRFGASVAHMSRDLLPGTNLVLIGDPGGTGDIYSPEKDFFSGRERGNVFYIGLSDAGEIQVANPLDSSGMYLPYSLQEGSSFGEAIAVLPIDALGPGVKTNALTDQLAEKDIFFDNLLGVFVGAPGHDGTAGGLGMMAVDEFGGVAAFLMFDEVNPLPGYTPMSGARLGSGLLHQRSFMSLDTLLYVGAKGVESWFVTEVDELGLPMSTTQFTSSQLLESDSTMPNWNIGSSFFALPGVPHYLVGAPTMDDTPPDYWPFNDQGGVFVLFGELDNYGTPRYSAKISNGSGAVNNPIGSRFGSSMALISTFDGLTVNGSVLAIGAPGSVLSEDESVRVGSVQFLYIESNYDAAF